MTDPLMWAMLHSLKRYDLTGQGDNTTNCIRYVWRVLWLVSVSLRPALEKHKSLLHLSGPGIGIGSFAHLDQYIKLGIAELADAMMLTPGWYLWQGWRKNGSGHCGFLLVLDDGTVWRIDASSDSEPAEETTYTKLEGAYKTFRLVRLRGGEAA